MSLKVKTISGIKWTTVSSVALNLLQLLQLAILTRFLSPSDFGLMAIVIVIIGFAGAFMDMGVSNAIIQRQNITHQELSSLYWLNTITGIAIFLITVAISPLISSFYGEPKLTELIILIATTFVIQSFGQQFGVLWQKDMRFGDIAKIEIFNKLVSFAASVYFAYAGHGIYALVYGTIAGSITQTLQYLYYGIQEYKPSFRFQIDDIRQFTSFGLYQMGERTINYFNSQIDTLLVGKLLGMEALGIYHIAKQIVMRPAQVFNPIVTRVTFPAMSKIQYDTPKLKEVYLKTINYLSSVNFPIYAFIFVFAHQIVSMIFGDQWLEAVLIIQILSVWAALRSTVNPIGSLLMAKGRADLGFWWNLGLFFYIPVGVWIASQWGLTGLAIGLNVIMFTLMYPMWNFLVKPLCEAGFVEYHKEIIKPAIIAIFAGWLAYGASLIPDDTILKLGLGIVVGFLSITSMNYYFNKPFLHILKDFRR